MKKILSDIQVLSESEIELIHERSLDILEKIGVRFPNAQVLRILGDSGAVIDSKKQVARFPRKLVEKCLSQAAKASEHMLRLEGAMHVNDGSFKFQMCSQMNFFDYETQTRRTGTLVDVTKGIVLGNALQHVGVVNGIVTPSDVPLSLIDVYTCRELLVHTDCARKKSRLWIYSPQSAKFIIEMTKAAVGADKFAREKPIYFTVEAVSPLGYSDHSLAIALVMVKAGLNVFLGPIPMAGATAPVTRAGVLTLANAETLGGITFVQCLNPHQPAIYNGASHTMDMKSTVCSFGSPNQTLLGIAHAQMARRYRLPANNNTGGTDSLAFDVQNGVQHGIGSALTMTAGVDIMIDLGMVGADQAASFEQLVLDNEWMDYLNFIFKGFEVSEETIAYDVIERVGIGGNFLMEEHTLEHMRGEYYSSDLFPCDNWDGWAAKGKPAAVDRAHERVKAVLKEGYPPKPVLSDSQVGAIDDLVKQAAATVK